MSQLNRTFRPLTAEELAFYDEPQPGDPDGLTSAYKVLVVQAPRFLHLPGTCNHLFCVYARYWVFLAIAHGDSASDWFHQACNPSCEYLPLPYSDSHSLSFHYGSPKIEITISSAATMASDLAWRILPGAKQRTTTKQESCSSGKHPLCSLMKGSDPLPKADENGFFWAVFTPIGTKFGTVIQKTRVNATYDFLDPTLDRIIKPIGTGAIDDNETNLFPAQVPQERVGGSPFPDFYRFPDFSTVRNLWPAPSAPPGPPVSPAPSTSSSEFAAATIPGPSGDKPQKQFARHDSALRGSPARQENQNK